MEHEPLGEEREVRSLGGITVDGAPISYVLVLAAVVTVIAMVPISVVLGGEGGFPMSQAIYPLVGWILGPVAGALSAGLGAFAGTLVAPWNNRITAVTVIGALAGSAAAGLMAPSGPRRRWWIGMAVLGILALLLYVGRAIVQNGVDPVAALLGSFINWSALLLFVLPTRTLVGRWLSHPDLKRVAVALFLGTWIAGGISHLVASALFYLLVNWPNDVWYLIAAAAPLEHLVGRAGVGTIIGTGVIAGLRATGLVKPEHALY